MYTNHLPLVQFSLRLPRLNFLIFHVAFPTPQGYSWMPNYMLHVVAGFLIEYLNLSWKHGELWFHDTLVDADVAINAARGRTGAIAEWISGTSSCTRIRRKNM